MLVCSPNSVFANWTGSLAQTVHLLTKLNRIGIHKGQWSPLYSVIARVLTALSTDFLGYTRNTQAYLCLAPMRRLCTHIICGCRWGVLGTRYVCCRRKLLGLCVSWVLWAGFSAFSSWESPAIGFTQYLTPPYPVLPSIHTTTPLSPTRLPISITKERRHPRSTTSIWVGHIWMCQTVWCTHGLYLWPWVGHMYVTTFQVTFLSVAYHVCTYVRGENRSLIQSLASMCSAINNGLATQWSPQTGSCIIEDQGHIYPYSQCKWQNSKCGYEYTIPRHCLVAIYVKEVIYAEYHRAGQSAWVCRVSKIIKAEGIDWEEVWWWGWVYAIQV